MRVIGNTRLKRGKSRLIFIGNPDVDNIGNAIPILT